MTASDRLSLFALKERQAFNAPWLWPAGSRFMPTPRLGSLYFAGAPWYVDSSSPLTVAMAIALTLPAPYHGMSHIWNVSANVGCDRATCPNRPDDVALVKYLISLNRQWAPTVHTGCNSPPMQVNDQFDAVLAFWITVFTTSWGNNVKGDMRVLVPARGTEPSAILLINDLAHQLSPVAWGNALGRFGLANTTTPIAASGGLASHTAIRRP